MNKTAGIREIVTDIAVVGYGGAGAASAIAAHDNGAKVVILEKMSEGGGNTRISAGSILGASGMEAVEHILALCCGVTERAIIKTYVQNAINNEDWVRKMGGETTIPSTAEVAYPSIPPSTSAWWADFVAPESLYRFRVRGEDKRGGERLWRLLATNVERRGIKVMTETSARELTVNANGEVVGVVVEAQGQTMSVIARRAVVLACGGFQNNDVMKQAFLPCGPFCYFGHPANTGDGIRMAQRVGAAMWHMTIVEGYLGFKPPEYEAAFPVRIPGNHFIYVNSYGNRFANETGLDLHDAWRAVSIFDPGQHCYPAIPAFVIFDEEVRKSGPLDPGTMGYNRDYEWSGDNSREIAKGWIKRGNTIADLAKQISIDYSTLAGTIDNYNKYCRLGIDSDFGRSKETLGPIEVAPYYAIELWPSLLNTQGGPYRDNKARVLDGEGKPIPRLYSAGELGSLWGILYEGGGNIAECLVFGRIAGKNAAAEKPW